MYSVLLILIFIFIFWKNVVESQSILEIWRNRKPCNKTLFEEWKQVKYQAESFPHWLIEHIAQFVFLLIEQGRLANDPNFWIYQQVSFFELTQGMAMDLAAAKCVRYFEDLHTFLAGRSGPIDIQHSYRAMCSKVCLESDSLINQAMKYSSCTCQDISTQPSDDTYTMPGDLCEKNSARLLCSMNGYCGLWDCRVDDFMCPRYEFNKKFTPLKGYGHCLSSSSYITARINWSLFFFVPLLLTIVLSFVML